jgi:cell wall-associated NlpC family hydrolase
MRPLPRLLGNRGGHGEVSVGKHGQCDVSIPDVVATELSVGPLVPADEPLLPGDLVFYGTPGNVHHVGLYIGARKIVHAPTFGEPVQVSIYRWNGDDYLAASRPAVDSRV